MTFGLNAEVYTWLEQAGVPAPVVAEVQQWSQAQGLARKTLTALLDERLPELGAQHRRHILEAAAVAAYHSQQEFPIVDLLICDDAPQFKRLTEELALRLMAWVHDGRHYKKLSPVVAQHRQELDKFLDRYWDYYDELLTYPQNPTPQEATRLSHEFEEMFSTVTGYAALDERIAKTKAKQDALLMVLKHPEIPLHDHPAELEARRCRRKSDVSLGPRTEEGKKAWDTFLSLVGTVRKLGVSFYQYVYDRVSGANKILQLADLITQQAEQRRLGASWRVTFALLRNFIGIGLSSRKRVQNVRTKRRKTY